MQKKNCELEIGDVIRIENEAGGPGEWARIKKIKTDHNPFYPSKRAFFFLLEMVSGPLKGEEVQTEGDCANATAEVREEATV